MRMKFINNTKEVRKVRRVDEAGIYMWVSVKPKDKIDLSPSHGQALGFTPVPEKKTAVQTSPVNSVEDPKESLVDYKKKLRSIRGIGKKTASDIVTIYPSSEDLKIAIKNDDRIPLNDDVALILKKHFK